MVTIDSGDSVPYRAVTSDQPSPGGAEDGDGRLARTLGELAVDMQAQADTAALLRTIVDASVMVVPGARWAGISLVEGRNIIPRVPTDPVVAELDELQRAMDDGPCLYGSARPPHGPDRRHHRRQALAELRSRSRRALCA
jgi:hypothetical protein